MPKSRPPYPPELRRRLVEMVRVETSVAAAALVPAFAVLRIHLVPEPGTFLLFSSGMIALGFAGRRRAKK
ncbi:MAG: PEP-CTERM sorting domain-containing protein [Myxococcales bacterium]|nr:PEP-CTERM sorting domain-containing protein [Myxococcales bacterium]